MRCEQRRRCTELSWTSQGPPNHPPSFPTPLTAPPTHLLALISRACSAASAPSGSARRRTRPSSAPISLRLLRDCSSSWLLRSSMAAAAAAEGRSRGGDSGAAEGRCGGAAGGGGSSVGEGGQGPPHPMHRPMPPLPPTHTHTHAPPHPRCPPACGAAWRRTGPRSPPGRPAASAPRRARPTRAPPCHRFPGSRARSRPVGGAQGGGGLRSESVVRGESASTARGRGACPSAGPPTHSDIHHHTTNTQSLLLNVKNI